VIVSRAYGISIPTAEKPSITRPRTRMPVALKGAKFKPLAEPELLPFSSICKVGGQAAQLAPGWVVPSIDTASVIVGRALSGVMVCTPLPGTLNWISFGPADVFGVLLESVMAWRREPAPESAGVRNREEVNICFYSADVASCPLRAGHAALIGGCTGAVVASINRRTSYHERHGLGCTAIIGQRSQQGSACVPGQVFPDGQLKLLP